KVLSLITLEVKVSAKPLDGLSSFKFSTDVVTSLLVALYSLKPAKFRPKYTTMATTIPAIIDERHAVNFDFLFSIISSKISSTFKHFFSCLLFIYISKHFWVRIQKIPYIKLI